MSFNRTDGVIARKYRLVLFGLSLLILVVVGRSVTGTFSFLVTDFWFASGLLLVILLSVVDQPHFSRDANVFVNSIAATVSLIGVTVVRRDFLWFLFFGWSIWLMLTSYLLMIVRSKPLPRESGLTQVVSRINRDIGRPEAIFSAFFLWGVAKQFSQASTAYRVLLLYWAVFILSNTRSIAATVAGMLSKPPIDRIDGRVLAFNSPRNLECELDSSLPMLQAGTSIIIENSSRDEVATATIIDDRVLNGRRFARAAITSSGEAWRSFADTSTRGKGIVVRRDPAPQSTPVAVVGVGSTIGVLRFLINPNTNVVEGEVVGVDLADERHAYYQIVAATLKEETIDDNSAVQDVEVTASQLGVWHEDRCRFEPVTWVAPAGGLVLRLPDGQSSRVVPLGHLAIGHVPNSSFPVHVSLSDIVTHNTALIGVTGSGKSYLAFWILEALAVAGVRLLILDISRQHWIFLQHLNPFAIKTSADVDSWLRGTDAIGIYQYATSTNYPQTTAEMVERAFKQLESSTKLRAGENEPAKLCVVFEEAHSLIPEWNQVAQQGDAAFVNRTARAILQGRKYGMGSIVITQRTANVTKTILNQCNTMLALQSFDQTGLDFMSNYMGTAYANVISTLPSRHAVLVGKASSSMRPILFRITDLDEHWREEALE